MIQKQINNLNIKERKDGSFEVVNPDGVTLYKTNNMHDAVTRCYQCTQYLAPRTLDFSFDPVPCNNNKPTALHLQFNTDCPDGNKLATVEFEDDTKLYVKCIMNTKLASERYYAVKLVHKNQVIKEMRTKNKEERDLKNLVYKLCEFVFEKNLGFKDKIYCFVVDKPYTFETTYEIRFSRTLTGEGDKFDNYPVSEAMYDAYHDFEDEVKSYLPNAKCSADLSEDCYTSLYGDESYETNEFETEVKVYGTYSERVLITPESIKNEEGEPCEFCDDVDKDGVVKEGSFLYDMIVEKTDEIIAHDDDLFEFLDKYDIDIDDIIGNVKEVHIVKNLK